MKYFMDLADHLDRFFLGCLVEDNPNVQRIHHEIQLLR